MVIEAGAPSSRPHPSAPLLRPPPSPAAQLRRDRPKELPHHPGPNPPLLFPGRLYPPPLNSGEIAPRNFPTAAAPSLRFTPQLLLFGRLHPVPRATGVRLYPWGAAGIRRDPWGTAGVRPCQWGGAGRERGSAEDDLEEKKQLMIQIAELVPKHHGRTKKQEPATVPNSKPKKKNNKCCK